VRLNKSSWARTAALTTALAIIGGMTTAQIASAQQTPPVALEQARSGEDGTSGAGATSGGFSTGNAKRDKSGNGSSSTASAGSAGDTGGTDTAAPAEELPPNADVLAALGVLDDAQTYDLDILTGLNIPLELLPPPPAEDAPAPPEDINTGGGGDASSVSTEPGSGSAPAGGSTDTTAGDGTGATDSGEAKHDRPHHNQTDGTTTDSGSGTSTDGGTDTSSDTGQ
jgi:hypothetical protein